jgi:hypothetical protein
MKPFEPENRKHVLLGDVGISWVRTWRTEEEQRAQRLTGRATCCLRFAIDCHLVGMEEEVPWLLDRALEMLLRAIEVKETYGGFPPDFIAAQQYGALALCRWLRGAEHDRESLRLSAEAMNRHLMDSPKEAGDSFSLGLSIPIMVEAGDFETVLSWINSEGGPGVPKPPAKARSAAHVCGLIALHEVQSPFSPEEVDKAVIGFLNRHMNNWLMSGHEIQAAQWLKIWYGQRGAVGLPPREVILKAYEHLLSSSRPEWLPGQGEAEKRQTKKSKQ